MTRPHRNPRHAYDADGREIRPMDLGNMRGMALAPSRRFARG